jgi:protein TonB
MWWLARWLGLPFLLIVGLYYAEPLFRGGPVAEFVQTVTRQEVHPYPFTDGAAGPSLAPPEVPRAPAAAPPILPTSPLPLITASEIVAHPIEQPRPIYPLRALEREKEGVVRLRVTIAPDGHVADAVVVYANPPGWFETAAIAAVKRWRYQPPGRILEAQAEIEFKLD